MQGFLGTTGSLHLLLSMTMHGSPSGAHWKALGTLQHGSSATEAMPCIPAILWGVADEGCASQ